MAETRHWRGIRTNLLVALASVLVTLLVVVAAGEWLVRYRETHRSEAPGTMGMLFYQHDRLRHALVRNFEYFGWVHINSAGFRGAELSPLEPGTLRLMAVGGSTTFDSRVSSEDAAWPARLESWLEEGQPDLSVQVINAGTPGYLVEDNLIRLVTELHHHCPDAIILYHAHNDLRRSLGRARRRSGSGPSTAPGPQRPGEMQPRSGVAIWLSQHSLLYTKVRERLMVMRGRDRTRAVAADYAVQTRDEDGDAMYRRRLDRGRRDFERNVGAFIAVARSMGIQVFVPEAVIMRGSANGGDSTELRRVSQVFGLPADVVFGEYDAYNRAVQRIAAEYGAIGIPTSSFGLRTEEWFADGDPVHFNDAGADQFARNLAGALAPELGALQQGSDTTDAAFCSRPRLTGPLNAVSAPKSDSSSPSGP